MNTGRVLSMGAALPPAEEGLVRGLVVVGVVEVGALRGEAKALAVRLIGLVDHAVALDSFEKLVVLIEALRRLWMKGARLPPADAALGAW